jgi:ATP-dependent DNA helicase PIF1
VIAPTNLAALAVGGRTTYNYAGWYLKIGEKYLATIKAIACKNKEVVARMQETDVLVIDEISMIENIFFERLNCLMQEIGNNQQAFGGVQIVVTGDVCRPMNILHDTS